MKNPPFDLLVWGSLRLVPTTTHEALGSLLTAVTVKTVTCKAL